MTSPFCPKCSKSKQYWSSGCECECGGKKMNIIEAVNSGKKFRRHHWDKFYRDATDACPSNSDILADDWEVEEKRVLITHDQLKKAFDIVMGKDGYVVDNLAKELGLID